jgi:hypothetical protein
MHRLRGEQRQQNGSTWNDENDKPKQRSERAIV